LAGGALTKLPEVSFAGTNYIATLPAQSVTLFIFPSKKINAGGAAYTSPRGPFAADSGFTGGSPLIFSAREIAQTGDDPLYLAQRHGPSFGYSVPVANGQYSVRLHFAECQYGGAGKRKFNVRLNGATVLANYDPLVAAGAANRAVISSFPVNVTGGSVELVFTSTIAGRNAAVAAIEVLAK
jgi:hypothetical protein